jgi:3-oxoacyl-[acyl-carrier-protein] synthase II
MNSTKSMIGHLLGGAGAVEAIATIKAVETGWLHPTINLADPEDGVDPAVVCAGEKQQARSNGLLGRHAWKVACHA